MTTKLRSVDGWDGAHVAMVILQGLGDVYSGGLWQLGILYVISIFHRDATSINSIDLLKLFK